ncbi:hypothetical protein SAMN04488000_106266 [Lentzea albida]|uniref:Uncharacterized protein n=1 Tax=Lentzea albida TaxID=65499 RepID=A0A1H9LTP0_9PSEU|nr:hypothetical protein SAMN04488000_106266 [Lentzea albida]
MAGRGSPGFGPPAGRSPPCSGRGPGRGPGRGAGALPPPTPKGLLPGRGARGPAGLGACVRGGTTDWDCPPADAAGACGCCWGAAGCCGAGRGPGRGPPPGLAPGAGAAFGAAGADAAGAGAAAGAWDCTGAGAGAAGAGVCAAEAAGAGFGAGGRGAAGRGPGMPLGAAGLSAAGFDSAGAAGAAAAAGAGALGFGADGLGAGFEDLASYASRSRRATGASTVDDADFTYSPCSASLLRTSLLVTPSSFASSCTRALPATALLGREAGGQVPIDLVLTSRVHVFSFTADS